MNRREAIQAMLEGKRVRRPGWAPTEYVHMNELGLFVDEESELIDINTAALSNTGYQIWCEPNPHIPGTFAWAREEAKRGKVVYRPNFGQVGFRVEHFGSNVPWNLGHIDATDWESRDA